MCNAEANDGDRVDTDPYKDVLSKLSNASDNFRGVGDGDDSIMQRLMKLETTVVGTFGPGNRQKYGALDSLIQEVGAVHAAAQQHLDAYKQERATMAE
jgi:hypothetical protein